MEASALAAAVARVAAVCAPRSPSSWPVARGARAVRCNATTEVRALLNPPTHSPLPLFYHSLFLY